MLLVEIAKLIEMARPAKICPDCGKSMAGNHFWYKGGWKCKKANRKGGEAAEGKKDEKKPEEKKAPEKKEAPASRPQDKKDDKKKVKSTEAVPERGADEEQDPDVKAAEREKGKKKEVGRDISRSEIGDIHADTEDEARKQINDMFPKASPEQKSRAVNIWKAIHKNKD